MKRAWLAAVPTVVGVVLVGVGVPTASAGGSSIVADPFTEVTSANTWVLPSGSSPATNQACLTAGTSTAATPIPGCRGTSPTAGLRLNAASPDQEGGIYYGSSVDATDGLDAVFDSTAVSGANGSGAEGSSFFVAASDPSTAAASAVTLGPDEGHLGYSADSGALTPAAIDGLTNGYLDVGLDTAGNYASVANSGAGCNNDPSATLPNSVVIRGPGSGTAGYCVVGHESQFDGSFDSQSGTTLHVEVAVNPTSADLVDAGGFTVEPGTFEVEANPGGGALQVVTSGSLPNASGVYAKSGLVDAGGVPLRFSFGWTGSSNASSGPSDVNTISNASVTTLTDSGSASAVCSPNRSCTVKVAGAPGTGVSAVVIGAAAPNATELTARFGGDVAPLHPCDSSAAGVLTFNGARQKDIRFTVATERPIFLFCYGQPKPFIDLSLHRTRFFSATNQEYEGLLAPCIAHLVPAPCIRSLSIHRRSETATVIGGSGDPRMSH